MSVLYKAFVILVALFALISLALNFFILDKQNNTQVRNQKLFADIHHLSILLDKDSGTSYSKSVTLKNLGSTNNNFFKSIEDFKNQVTKIYNQRNTYATELSSSAKHLKLQGKFTKRDFTNLTSYNRSISQFNTSLEKLDIHNKKNLTYYIKISELINKPISDEEAFFLQTRQIGQTSPYLKKLQADISELMSRERKQKKIIQKANYQIAEFKTKLDLTIKKHKMAQENISDSKKELNKISLSAKRLNEQLRKDLQHLVERKIKIEDKTGKEYPTKEELLKKLTGKVIYYNPKWEFIVIDLGKENEVEWTSKDGIIESGNISLEINNELLIARKDNFITKALIVKVENDFSIANIIPPTAEKVKINDRVFYHSDI